MNKKDLRITKTENALCDAFLNLLEKKRFEDITINELCDAAVIRRATFYKHFTDKYNFLTFFFKHVQTSFEAEYESSFEDMSTKEYVLQCFRQTFQFLNAHQKLIDSLRYSNMLHTITESLSEYIFAETKKQLEKEIATGHTFTISCDLLAAIHSGAVTHILLWWFTANREITEDELMEQLEYIYSSINL